MDCHACKSNVNDVQILFGDNDHWICTLYKKDEGKIIVYDSLHNPNWFSGLFSGLSKEQKGVLQKLYPFIPANQLNNAIEFRKPLVVQNDNISCGIFALYYMKLIMDGHLPDKSVDVEPNVQEDYRRLIIDLRCRLRTLLLDYAKSLNITLIKKHTIYYVGTD